MINTVQKSVLFVRNEACGGLEPFSEYRQRPDGGKWYALGNRYPENYDNAKSCHIPYGINGEWGSHINGFLGTKFLMLHDYDTKLCRVHELYGKISGKENALKMLYSVYTDNKDAFSAIDKCCLDSIDKFIEKGLLSKDASGKLICEVPVVEEQQRQRHYALSEKYASLISEKFHDTFMSLMKKPMEIPSHVKSYVKWERYDKYCCYLPMAIILMAKEEGLYNNTEAAIIMNYGLPC